MRKPMIAAILPMACMLSTQTMAAPDRVTDSAKINHVIDGNISEWKIEKFETDKETRVLYCIDHDAGNLYMALKIMDQRTQMKMMTQGMSMFIDKKGKKKENTGIEFPVKKEGGGFGGGARGQSGNRTAPDPKEMREKLTATMIFLKSFGFDDQEDKTQLIAQPNGINIAFEWDDNNIMYIEYQVPISFLGTGASLNGKPLGIGWKINGMSAPGGNGNGNAVITSTQLVAVPAGSGGGRSSGGGGGGRSGGFGPGSGVDFGPSASDSRFREQNIWTKYVLTF